MGKKLSHKERIKQNRQRAKDLFKKPKESQSKSKKAEKLSLIDRIRSNFFLKLLLSVLAILVPTCTLYFTCSRYYDDKPAQVTKEFCFLDNTLNVDYYGTFISLLHSSNRRFLICNDHEMMNRIYGCPFPSIINHSNKTINDFKVEVDAYINGSYFFKEKDINKDFEITKIDSIQKTDPGRLTSISFKYKYDLLHAKSSVASPFNVVYLPDSAESSDFYDVILFNYRITYEGIKETINYVVFLYLNYNDNNTLTGNTIENYLNELYVNNAAGLRLDHTLISIRERGNFIIINPEDLNVNQSDFEVYKSSIINKYNQETKKEQIKNSE